MSDEKNLSNVTSEAMPAFLSVPEGEKPVGTGGLEKYLRPSFGKVIQGQTKAPLKPPFTDGDLIILPEQIKVCSEREQVAIVPIFWYPEYCLHNPYGAKEFIAARSLDPESEIAQRCMSRDRDKRQFPSDEVSGKYCEYKEHINFAVVFPEIEEIAGKIVILSFSGGEWKYGGNFASLITNRSVKHICGNRFQMMTTDHSGGGNTWKGIHVQSPSDGIKYITNEDQFNSYVKLHEKIAAFHKANALEVNYEVENENEAENEFA